MAAEFWLSDGQWAAIEPLLPKNQPGPARDDDRRVISGIVYVLKIGCRWRDCPAVYGPPTTIYNRFRRWAMRGIVEAAPDGAQFIDSSTAKAHRSAAGGRGAPTQAIGRSRGVRTTKIHGVVDAEGRPIAIEVTPGCVSFGSPEVAGARRHWRRHAQPFCSEKFGNDWPLPSSVI